MARVGGEHLGAGVGVGTLFCLIGHATTTTAAAGAFPGSSEWRQASIPRLLACLACCRCPLLSGMTPEVAWGERGGEAARRKREDADAGGRGHSLAWARERVEGRGGAILRFGTRLPRCTQAPVLPVLKASISLICGAWVAACATPAGKGPLAERRSNCNVQYCMELPRVDGCEGPLPCAGSLDFLEHTGDRGRLSP